MKALIMKLPARLIHSSPANRPARTVLRDNTLRAALLGTICGFAILVNAPAFANEMADDADGEKKPIIVEGRSEAESGYKVSDSRTGTRTDTPLINTPQAVNIVSEKQITDQAANSISSAIRYVPGVFSAQGEGNRETLVFRGNSTTGDFFVDGVRDDVQTYRDLYNIERLEIFKGPNAMIFGRGGIGGLANRVTKVANGQLTRNFRLEGGSDKFVRAQFDLGAPISEAFSARITGVYQDSDSYRDDVNYNRWGFNPTIAVKIGPDTLVQAGYEHFQDDRIADRGVPARFGAGVNGAVVGPLRTPRGQFFGDPANSETGTNTDAATLFIEHNFSEKISIRNRTRYADYDKFYSNVYPGAVNATETTVTILAYRQFAKRKNLINQTDFNAEFNTGGIKHTLLIGAEFARQKSDNIRQEGRFAGNAASVTVPISASNSSIPVTWVQIATSGDNDGLTTVAAGYIQDQIEFSPAIQLVLGGRFERVNTKVNDRRTVGFPVGQQRAFDVTDHLFSPRAGLIYKPAENASIYAAYSRTYLPRGGDQFTSLSVTNQNLDPETYQNYEIGAKWDILPKLNVQAAVFQLDRDNVLALSNPNDATSPLIPVGRQRTRGVELSAAGNVSDQLSMVAAYTYSDGKFLDNVSGTVRAGNQLPNMPKHSASLWTRFDPVRWAGAAVGVIYSGKRFAATDNFVALPGYTRVDAALFFKISDEVGAQINVENVLNSRYFLYAHSNNNITPGAPTTFKVALNAKF
jgi:catecholate siderophore receptor